MLLLPRSFVLLFVLDGFFFPSLPQSLDSSVTSQIFIMVSTQSAPASSSEKVPDAEADYQIGNTMLGTSASISRGESAVDVEAQPHNNEAQSQHDPIPPKAEAVSRPTSQPHFSDNREVIPELAPKTEVDWPTSPMNPFNWPKSKRIYHTTMPALFALVVYVSFLSNEHDPSHPNTTN